MLVMVQGYLWDFRQETSVPPLWCKIQVWGVDICDEADSRTQRAQSYSKVPFINQEPESHYVLGVEIDSLVVIDDSFFTA